MKTKCKKTLMLVEDQRIIALATQTELEQFGYKVLIAHTGEKAIVLSKEAANIDLILMDINLGSGIDGTTAAELILKERDIPILFLSSHTEPEIVRKTEKISSYGYIVKSSGIAILDASIKMAFKLFNSKENEKIIDLIESKNILQNVLDTIPVRVFWKDLKGNFLGCNQLFAEDAGKSCPEELIGKNDYNMVWSEQAELYRKDDKKVITSGQAKLKYEEDLITAQGESLMLSTSKIPLINSRGLLFGILGSYENITKSKQTENKLKESEQRFREIAENMSDWIWEVDTEGRYTYCSNKVEEILGYLPNEILGKTPFDFMLPEEQKRVSKIFREYISEKKSFRQLENWNLAKNGKHICLQTSGTPIMDKDGNFLGYRGIDSDITERKIKEKEMKASKIEAESANKAKSIFLANMSHELRTPLNAILGFSQVLQLDKEILTPRQMENLGYIRDSGEHLLMMVSDILDLSRIESGKMDIEKEPFDLGNMLREFISTLQSLADGKNIIMELDIHPDIGIIEADEKRIREIIYNLLSNAIKFTDTGKKIGIKTWPINKQIVIEVWDQGMGIENEDLEKIFDPFEQVGRAKPGTNKGTGLGLAITKKLIEAHNGTITVESTSGQGSIFTVNLPWTLEKKL